MVGELITLPVRIGVRATRLWLRAAEETVSIATSATGHLIGLASRGGGPSSESGASTPYSNGRSMPDLYDERRRDTDQVDVPSRSGEATRSQSSAETAASSNGVEAPPRREPGPPKREAAPPTREPAPTEREPRHVSEEPELVEEFAEPGAEDGAGAEIHIEAPWEGYAEMNAKQIVDRLGSATPAELAGVQLYESSHRRRQTVLNAVQRELRGANGRSSGTQQRG
jgi:hypothetical protein